MATKTTKTPARAAPAGRAPVPSPRPPPAVERFLQGIQTGDWGTYGQVLDPEALYDASVPGWRYQYEGPDRIVQEMREEWTGRNTWRIREQNVTVAGDTVVVDFEIRGTRPGPHHPHAPEEITCRIANVFRLRGGRIAEHRYYCCGEWPAEVVRHIEAEAPKARRGR